MIAIEKSQNENDRILSRHQAAFDAGMDAFMERKTGSLFDAVLPLLEIQQLVPLHPLMDRDFLTGLNT